MCLALLFQLILLLMMLFGFFTSVSFYGIVSLLTLLAAIFLFVAVIVFGIKDPPRVGKSGINIKNDDFGNMGRGQKLIGIEKAGSGVGTNF